jgi:hypothetical protein
LCAVAAGGMYIDPAFATKQRRLPPAGSTTTGEAELSAEAVAEHKAQAMQKLGLRTRIYVVRFAERQEWKREEPGDTKGFQLRSV